MTATILTTNFPSLNRLGKLFTGQAHVRFATRWMLLLALIGSGMTGLQTRAGEPSANNLAATSVENKNSANILTPAPSKSPRINGTRVLGVRPNSPVLFKIAATGEKPLEYKVTNLPKELDLDPITGILTGKFTQTGTHVLKVQVSNRIGTAKRDLAIKVGQTISLTPLMGWNSWNAFGLSVTQYRVQAAAKAMLDKGLIDHGWTYVNIDDGWEAAKRTKDGVLLGNEKFPDIKELADWLHARGMKLGIYSSPGPTTCGGFLGSYKYEAQDAATFAEWEVDLLKYDLCSYKWDIFDKEGDNSEEAWMKPFLTMRKELDKHPRDIIYSICSYNTILWAAKVGANQTRLTGDMRDTWAAILNNGFGIVDQYWQHNRPGLWNDDDLLVVGNTSGGWENNARPNRLTPDEQYTLFSQWSLLATPLIISCDLSIADDFTIALLSNDEVIEVNQDPLGKQARRLVKTDAHQVWVKELEDGTRAVGIYNMREESQTITVKWTDLKMAGGNVRDLWRQKDLGVHETQFTTEVAPHGVTLVRVFHPLPHGEK
jgi:alpha-galactosidase